MRQWELLSNASDSEEDKLQDSLQKDAIYSKVMGPKEVVKIVDKNCSWRVSVVLL